MKTYDVLVIGAGIQGAGVAQAAAALGYRVLILEQFEQPAQGTSSRSSKLIHGGLRYLETGQFALVKECLQERHRLLHNAPHLVHMLPFYIPVYEQSHYSAWKITLGLSIYSLFSQKPFKRIPKTNWSSLNGLKKAGLKAVFQYYDAQTDDSALTRAVLKSALYMDATIHYNANFENAEIKEPYCLARYQRQSATHTIRAHTIINAAGPWVTQITKKIPLSQPQPTIELVQGTHIEVPQPKLHQGNGIYYLEAPQDHRAVFVMPWKNHLLLGTTETLYTGDPAKVAPLEKEIRYLLNVYNHYFTPPLHRSDVMNAFAGLRVLPKGEGKAFSRPRDTMIVGNTPVNPRILTLYGGKLTSYRATAEQVLKKLRPVLPKPSKQVNTRTLRLP